MKTGCDFLAPFTCLGHVFEKISWNLWFTFRSQLGLGIHKQLDIIKDYED